MKYSWDDYTILYKDAYLVYSRQGNIYVRKGDVIKRLATSSFPFKLKDGSYSYSITIRHRELIKPLTVYKGHTWCKSKEDIPKAIEVIHNYKLKLIKDLEKRLNKLKSESNKIIWIDEK